MRILDEGEVLKKSMAITLGNFDGLHLGHMKLVNRLIDIAAKTGRGSLVYVIENCEHDRILTKEQQACILENAGVDYVLFRKFTDEFKRIKAEAFLDKLKKRFNVGAVVVGDDYKFGNNKEGGISCIRNFFDVDIVKRVDDISSTSIRNSILKGDVSLANKMMGREFLIEGKVVEGRKIGRKIGFRTANQKKPDGIIIPKVGVYKTRTKYNNNIYNSITNIGTNPTVGALCKNSIETNILDFEEDIYGKVIEVSFIERIRGEKKFARISDLQRQIEKDVQKIKEGE